MDTNVLNDLLNAFRDVFTLGLNRIAPDAMIILGLIMTVEFALLGIWYVYGDGISIAGLAAKGMGAIFLGYLIEHWGTLTKTVIQGFIAVGLKAGGDAISVNDFTDPGNIAFYGISATATLFAHLMEYSAVDALKNLPEILLGVPIGLGIMLAYFLLGIWIFLTQLDFYLHATATVILLPFGLNSKVAFLTEKAIAVIFASAIRLLVLSLITSVALPLMKAAGAGTLNPTLKTITVQLLGALATVLLAWRADKSAQGLLVGNPQLHSADVRQVVRSTVAMTTRLGQVIQTMNRFLGLHNNGNQGQGARQDAVPQRRRP